MKSCCRILVVSIVYKWQPVIEWKCNLKAPFIYLETVKDNIILHIPPPSVALVCRDESSHAKCIDKPNNV